MNAELPRELMMDNWITPKDLFFIRHHHPVCLIYLLTGIKLLTTVLVVCLQVPLVNANDYTLRLGGKGVKPILLSLHELRTHFHKVG